MFILTKFCSTFQIHSIERGDFVYLVISWGEGVYLGQIMSKDYVQGGFCPKGGGAGSYIHVCGAV